MQRGAAGTFLIAVLGVALPSCIWVHTNTPWPDAYVPCSSDSQCPVGTSCWSVTIAYEDVWVTDSLCTLPCSFHWECPDDGSCQDPDGGPPLCYPRCYDDYDCYEGFACVAFAFDPVCVPW